MKGAHGTSGMQAPRPEAGPPCCLPLRRDGFSAHGLHGHASLTHAVTAPCAAYKAVEAYPLDVLGAQTEGMIGYVLQQELGNELPIEQRVVTLLTQIEVDPADSAFAEPTKPIGPIYTADEADALATTKGWAFKPDGDSMRRVVPPPV